MPAMTCSLILSSLLALAPPADGGAPPPDPDPTAPADSTVTDPFGDRTAPPGDAEATPAADPSTPAGDPATTGTDASAEATAPPGPQPVTPTQPQAVAPTVAPALPTPAVVATAPAPTRPDRPIRWRLDFGLDGGGTVVKDAGFRAFGERRNLGEFGASALFDFRLAQGRVFLGGGLSYLRLGSEGDAFAQDILTTVRISEPRALGRVSVMLVDGVDAFGMVGVGPSIATLTFASTQTAIQRAVIPRVDGQAGLSAYLPKRWLPNKKASRVTAGLNLAMGYTWRGNIAAQPTLSQGDDPLRATTSPFGDLSLHGLSWHLGLFVRVM